MSHAPPERIRTAARAKITRIKQRIAALDDLCSGTLVKRWKVCGKAGCRCAHDEQARHGPYYEWGSMQGGRQVHRMVTPQQARVLRVAIRNHRQVRRLLRAWETQTVRILKAEDRRK
ncbi:MAG: hypothetical protein FJ280_26610 [Planctomycetes bacterium]|nr:hypothetical protein [Planctomycetota bacterium]